MGSSLTFTGLSLSEAEPGVYHNHAPPGRVVLSCLRHDRASGSLRRFTPPMYHHNHAPPGLPVHSASSLRKEKLLFDQIDRLTVKQKLFLQPGFSRDEAAALAKITPKHLSALFQQFANGFPDYINTLRLEYSVTILKTKPNYTVEGISQESGFSSRQTFHRLFVEKYGMTPTEFRS